MLCLFQSVKVLQWRQIHEGTYKQYQINRRNLGNQILWMHYSRWGPGGGPSLFLHTRKIFGAKKLLLVYSCAALSIVIISIFTHLILSEHLSCQTCTLPYVYLLLLVTFFLPARCIMWITNLPQTTGNTNSYTQIHIYSSFSFLLTCCSILHVQSRTHTRSTKCLGTMVFYRRLQFYCIPLLVAPIVK